VIQFTQLVAAIQSAARQASQTVTNEQRKLISTFFHSSDGPAPKGADGANAKTVDRLTHLTPKMVVMKYPRETADGADHHRVMVPLISLTPISNLQMSSMKVEIDLEVMEDEDHNDVIVGFPSHKKTFFGGEKTVEHKPNAKVTIEFNADDHPEGMKSVIEGYDKSLRAQIPS